MAPALLTLLPFVACMPLDAAMSALQTKAANATSGGCEQGLTAPCQIWGEDSPPEMCIGTIESAYRGKYRPRCVASDSVMHGKLTQIRDKGRLFRRCPVGGWEHPRAYDGFQFWCSERWCDCQKIPRDYRAILVAELDLTPSELDNRLAAAPDTDLPPPEPVSNSEQKPEPPSLPTSQNEKETPQIASQGGSGGSTKTADLTGWNAPRSDIVIRCVPTDDTASCDLRTHVCVGNTASDAFGLKCVSREDLAEPDKHTFVRCAYSGKCDGFSFWSGSTGACAYTPASPGWCGCSRFEDAHRNRLRNESRGFSSPTNVDQFLTACDPSSPPLAPPKETPEEPASSTPPSVSHQRRYQLTLVQAQATGDLSYVTVGSTTPNVARVEYVPEIGLSVAVFAADTLEVTEGDSISVQIKGRSSPLACTVDLDRAAHEPVHTTTFPCAEAASVTVNDVSVMGGS